VASMASSMASIQQPQNFAPQSTAAANAALAAAQWSHQGRQGIASPYSHEEIERMAEYSASLYAKTASEKAHYLEYYRNYYKNGGQDKDGTSNGKKATPMPNNQIVKAVEVKKEKKVLVNGVEYPRYRKDHYIPNCKLSNENT